MPTSDSKKGAITLLVPIIIGAIIAGGVFLISKNSSTTSKTDLLQEKTPNITNTVTATPPSTVQWETYTDQKSGYSLKHPKGWKVENLPTENSRLIKVSDTDKTAFVLIEGIAGPNLEKEGELEKVMSFLEDKLKKDTHLKIDAFTRSNEKNMSGYLATGEQTYDNKTVEFEERFMVWKNGRGLRLHSGYAPETKEINKPITSEIMTSFTAN